MDSLNNFFDSVLQFFSDLYDSIVDAIAEFFLWLSDLFMKFIEPYLSSLEELFPNLSSFWDDIEVIQPYVAFVNTIIPLDMISRFIGYYFAFIISYLYIKAMIRIMSSAK